MIAKWIYIFFFGYVHIIVEGFFLERFINTCIDKGIVLLDIKKEKNTIFRAKIIRTDFKKIINIAKRMNCKIRVSKKVGIPFLLNRYKKRKIFVIAVSVIAIFLFSITRFIWNIEVFGLENTSYDDVITTVNDNGIEIGKLKSNINLEKIINQIRLERDDIAWVGIKLKGTNALITIVETIKQPEIIDRNEVCNIISNKDAIISKIVVQNGTARVKVGDIVKEGDILVEGIIEGQYTGNRYVHSEADIYANIFYEKERKESFIQEVEIKTGNMEKKNEIYINNFKINFNKRVSKFQNYDTIRTYKKLKFFSNYYFPVELVRVTNVEIQKEYKVYTEEELKNKIIEDLEEELNRIIDTSKYSNINKNVITEGENDGIKVKLIYKVQEKIGNKQK